MHAFDDPVILSPDQRREQIASILATAIIRLSIGPPTSDCSHRRNDSQVSASALEVSQEIGLSVNKS